MHDITFVQFVHQIGCRFWELALREHAAYSKGARFDDALSSFFRNVDSRHDPPQELPVGVAIKTLKVKTFVFIPVVSFDVMAVNIDPAPPIISPSWPLFNSSLYLTIFKLIYEEFARILTDVS